MREDARVERRGTGGWETVLDAERALEPGSEWHSELYRVAATAATGVSNEAGINPLPCHAVDQGTKENPRPDGSGFDWGLRRMEDLFTAKHAHRIVNKPWGNTDPFRQCDDEYAGSNGTSLLITMGKM